MAPKGPQAPVHIQLTTDEEFDKVFGDNAEAGFLCVVEIFSAWCGPSTAAISTINAAFQRSLGRKVKFYQANTKDIAELGKYKEDAKPRFLFLRDGEQLEAVEGVNAPAISRCCDEYLPEGMVETEEVTTGEGGDEEEDD